MIINQALNEVKAIFSTVSNSADDITMEVKFKEA